MLYLEARCLVVVRAAGSQGIQNGSISCIALALAVPGGTREVLAENVLARVARPRGRLGKRRDREPFRDPQDRQADGPVPARHRLRHLGLLGDAALRQHVRRRQLRLARPRRVADAPARLAGRRRDRAARRGAARWPCASAARAPCRPSSTCSGSRRSRTRRCGSRRRASTRATCRTATGRPTSLPATACWASGSAASTSHARSSERGFAEVAEAVFGMQLQKVAARLPPDLRDHRADGTVVSAVNDANSYSGPGTGYRLEGERWQRLQQLPYTIDARLLGAAADGRARRRGDRPGAERRPRRTRS